jgi:hypothetical protein
VDTNALPIHVPHRKLNNSISNRVMTFTS